MTNILLIRPLPVRLFVEPESPNFFENLFELLTFQHLSGNSRINFLLFSSRTFEFVQIFYQITIVSTKNHACLQQSVVCCRATLKMVLNSQKTASFLPEGN